MSKATTSTAKAETGVSIAERELRLELQARTAEAAWLKSHYDRELREAYGRIEALQDEVQRLTKDLGAGRGPAFRGDDDRLQAEYERLVSAEQRYLERIDELKGARAAGA